jgi:hypothetical protein
VVPTDDADRQRLAEVLTRFGHTGLHDEAPRAAVLLDNGADALASVIRAIDAEALRMDSFQVHMPTLDDVFWPRQASRSPHPT